MPRLIRGRRQPNREAVPRVSVRSLTDERRRASHRRDALAQAIPYLAVVKAPSLPTAGRVLGRQFSVATYNVHRWSGHNGTRAPDPARAGFVISEMGADIIALQEALRPFDERDPLVDLAERLQMHLAFVTTRVHRRGEVGNAILSRWPISSLFTLDLTYTRVERRSAVAVQFASEVGPLSIVATHLSLVDRTRHRQVRSILEHPQLQGAVVLLGDMNAWRRCKASRALEKELVGEDRRWPRTFPAARPVLALDRVYARGAEIEKLEAYATAAAKRASDHLPVTAEIRIL